MQEQAECAGEKMDEKTNTPSELEVSSQDPKRTGLGLYVVRREAAGQDWVERALMPSLGGLL